MMQLFFSLIQLIIHCKSGQTFSLMFCFSCALLAENSKYNDENATYLQEGVVRIIQPGVFDYQINKFLVRMRAWGVAFPAHNKPGYKEAINFTENQLLNSTISISVRKEFDSNNLKVVELFCGEDNVNFSQQAILQGVGWHLEQETSRHGVFVISQIKAKRESLGIWRYGDLFKSPTINQIVPAPMLRSMIGQNPFSPSIEYWVTSFGKIHRPGCSFYQRGRGALSRRPTGTDCRLCGGVKNRDQ